MDQCGSTWSKDAQKGVTSIFLILPSHTVNECCHEPGSILGIGEFVSIGGFREVSRLLNAPVFQFILVDYVLWVRRWLSLGSGVEFSQHDSMRQGAKGFPGKEF